MLLCWSWIFLFVIPRVIQVASSLSWDNSYEVADFDGVVGEIYHAIKVHRWPSSSNPKASAWFGIAWDLQS